jgi:hypothetical protein
MSMAAMAPPALGDTILGETSGYTYVVDTMAMVGAYSFTVDCPAGTHVAGGGFAGTLVFRSEAVDDGDSDREPDDGWRIGAYQGSGDPADAFAICTAQRSSYVTRLHQLDGGSARSVKARCPRGTKVISGGGSIRGLAAGQARLSTSMPFDGPDADWDRDDGWRVRAYSPTEAGALRAQAVCRHADPLYPEQSGALPMSGVTYPIGTCPPTYHLVGIGGDSTAQPDVSFLVELSPLDDGSGMGSDADAVPDDRGRAGISNNSPVPATATGVAVCLE